MRNQEESRLPANRNPEESKVGIEGITRWESKESIGKNEGNPRKGTRK